MFTTIKLLASVLILASVVLAAAGVVSAQVPAGAETTYRGLIDANNRGDLAAVLGAFTDDAVMIRGPLCPPEAPCRGKPAIQRQFENQIRANLRWTVIGVAPAGNGLAARVEFRGTAPTQAGVERVIEKHSLEFSGDRISRLATEFDPSDPQSATFIEFGRVAGANDRLIDALSSRDAQVALANTAPGATFEGFVFCPEGAGCSLGLALERAAADNLRITRFPQRVSGDVATRPVELRSTSISARGFERLLATTRTEVKGNLVISFRIDLNLNDEQTAAFAAGRAAAPSAPPIQPPSTGDGGLAEGQGGSPLFGAALALAAPVLMFVSFGK